MTLQAERRRAVLSTREFLRKLLDSDETPRVPKPVRSWAYMCLKHYPTEYDMRDIKRAFGK